MAGQVKGGSAPEHGVPTGAKLTDVEITQTRNLDVQRLAVLLRRTDRYAWHGAHTASGAD
jgi:hypothetical protein